MNIAILILGELRDHHSDMVKSLTSDIAKLPSGKDSVDYLVVRSAFSEIVAVLEKHLTNAHQVDSWKND